MILDFYRSLLQFVDPPPPAEDSEDSEEEEEPVVLETPSKRPPSESVSNVLVMH